LGTAPPTWPAAGTAAKLAITADKTTIMNDGTDDCQLIISVQNAGGQLINNNVSGALQITSGPGLLPTGTSWTFTTPDGQQAIEMRSYGTGGITLTASAAGLQNGTINIVAKEAPVAAKRFGDGLPPHDDFVLSSKIINTAVRSVRISYRVPRAGLCRLLIYNVHGRVVRILKVSHKRAGEYATVWDGRNDRGNDVADGCYIVAFQANGMKKNGLLHVLGG
jgi:hypothetical protein